MEFKKTFISFGANLPTPQGEPAETLRSACHLLDRPELQLVRTSSIWQTPAWPDPSDPPFANAVAMFMCAMTPARLLDLLLATETDFGRKRGRRNGPRTLDLDILDFNGLTRSTKRLVLPHPRMHDRAFMLLPLLEVDPDWRHPVLCKMGSELVASLSKTDKNACKILGPML